MDNQIKQCPNCGNTIDVRAVMCPRCGWSATTYTPTNNSKTNKHNGIKLGCLGAVVSLLLVGFIGSILAPHNNDASSDKTVITTGIPKDDTEKNDAYSAGKDLAESFNDALSGKDSNSDPTAKPTKKPMSKSKYISKCKQYKYKQLKRNPDNYLGKKIKISCKVQQVLVDGDTRYYNVATNNEYDTYLGDNMVICDTRDNPDELKILEDDVITVYGEFEGLENETSALLGTESEYPKINMEYVKLISE